MKQPEAQLRGRNGNKGERDHEKGTEGHREVQSETMRNRDKPETYTEADWSGYTLSGAQTPWFFQNGWGP